MQEHLVEGMATFEAETNDIIVSVQAFFLDEQSDPDEGHFVWAYRIRIRNDGDNTVQLLTRHWDITDALGHTTVVDGDGVIGEQPILAPGEDHVYTSGTPLKTPSGFMGGHYGMRASTGMQFDVKIPHFSLDSPYHQVQIN